MPDVVRTWEWHPNSGSGTRDILSAIAEAITGAAMLGMKTLAVTTERTDHFMNGGNVVKGECVTFTLTLGDRVPQYDGLDA